MTERVLSPPTPSSAPLPADAVDPDLASLPEPPRGERRATLALLGITAMASLAMTLTLARDAAYAFASADVAEVGDLRTAAPSSLAPDSFVRGHGMLGAAGSIRFERAFESDTFRLAPVAGRPDVWVELRVPAGVDPGRYVPPTSFEGHLVHFDGAGTRHRGLGGSVKALTGQTVAPGAWLLVDGETPANARWAVALVVLFAGFAAWNAVAIGRLVRKVK